jgi:hypothetical protein
MSTPADDDLTPAERRLVALLALLRADPVPVGPDFVSRVLRVAWLELLLRRAVRAVGDVGVTAAITLDVLLALRRRGGDR